MSSFPLAAVSPLFYSAIGKADKKGPGTCPGQTEDTKKRSESQSCHESHYPYIIIRTLITQGQQSADVQGPVAVYEPVCRVVFFTIGIQSQSPAVIHLVLHVTAQIGELGGQNREGRLATSIVHQDIAVGLGGDVIYTVGPFLADLAIEAQSPGVDIVICIAVPDHGVGGRG